MCTCQTSRGHPCASLEKREEKEEDAFIYENKSAFKREVIIKEKVRFAYALDVRFVVESVVPGATHLSTLSNFISKIMVAIVESCSH